MAPDTIRHLHPATAAASPAAVLAEASFGLDAPGSGRLRDERGETPRIIRDGPAVHQVDPREGASDAET